MKRKPIFYGMVRGVGSPQEGPSSQDSLYTGQADPLHETKQKTSIVGIERFKPNNQPNPLSLKTRSFTEGEIG